MFNTLVSLTLAVSLSFVATYAGELTTTLTTAAQADATVSLPTCIEDNKTLESIEETMRANRRNSHKYNGYVEALKTSTDLEVASRLAYAEVLAANCPSLNAKMIRPISEVIANRIAIRQNNARKVVFERDQFASSLNKYSSSRYKDFLCPKDLKLWQDVQTQMELALQKENPRLLPTDGVHYYFFQHDKKFTPPPWAQGKKSYPQIEFQDSNTIKDCVQFYRNPNW